jgi:hypothetical protein
MWCEYRPQHPVCTSRRIASLCAREHRDRHDDKQNNALA